MVGIGVTGVSCVRHLRRLGARVAAADSRVDPPGLAELASRHPDVPVFTGDFGAAPFDRAREIVVSPGVSLREPAVARAVARGAR